MAKIFLFCLIVGVSVFFAESLYSDQSVDSSFILPQYSQKISLDFKGADLKDVLKSFSKQIGANFIVDKNVTDLRVTLFLDNVPVEEALNKVLSVNGLTYDYDVSMNLFVVKAKDKVETQMTTRVYPLRYASVDSSKMKLATGSSASGGFSLALAAVLTSKGKVVDNARTNSIIVTDMEYNFPEIERMLAMLDVPLRQVVIEVEMLDVAKNSADKVGAKYNLAATFSGGKKTSYFPFDTANVIDKYSGTDTYTAGTVDFSTSTLALDFLKSQGDTKSLARPRIVTADNETATIQISTNEAIGLIDSTSSTSSSASTQTKEAERVSTGVFLTVTPQVNPVTDEITLVVEPKVIDASSFSTFEGKRFFNPEERSVKVTLRVPNGQTIVIGGLLRRSSTDSRTQVPFISKIPFFGAAFRHSEKATNDRELMVFLTPHVLDSDQLKNSDTRKDVDRQLQLREQTLLDARSGSIDKEMDEVNRFRKGL